MTDTELPDFDTMTPADFEKYLPDFFATGNGYVSTDPRLQTFLKNNPDCAALVRDLETIAEHAKQPLRTRLATQRRPSGATSRTSSSRQPRRRRPLHPANRLGLHLPRKAQLRSLREGWAIGVSESSPASIYLTEYPRASIQAENPCLNLFICWLYAAWAWLDCCCTCAPAAWDACCLDCSLAARCCRPPRTVPTVAPTAAPVPASPTIPPMTAPPTAPFAAPLRSSSLGLRCVSRSLLLGGLHIRCGRSLRAAEPPGLSPSAAGPCRSSHTRPGVAGPGSDCFWRTQTSRASAPQKTEEAAPRGPPEHQPVLQPGHQQERQRERRPAGRRSRCARVRIRFLAR